jgi:endonuclease-3
MARFRTMLKERLADKVTRTNRIVRRLHAAYPEVRCELNYSNPLELLIATILSAQCTDRQVNIVTEALFKRYPLARDYAGADIAQLEQDIRRIGLYRNKAKNIRAACQALVEHHAGDVPRTMQELMELGGVGRKTANVVLGNAFAINEGIVVDTHVARLSRRLGLSANTAPDKIEANLKKLVPQKEWTLFSHLLIWHGRRRCTARNPDCENCEINGDCPAGRKVLEPALTPERRKKLRIQI